MSDPEMRSLSCVEAHLPPGFRFHPKDEELIHDYLIKWVAGCPHTFPSLIVVDLNKCEPWDIPESACVGGKEWYFYSQRDRKYATGLRTNRATMSGYWKATGKDRPVFRKGALVGMRKTLVFYQGRAPKGKKSDWVMHEFRLHVPNPKMPQPIKEDWVLCRVFFKSRKLESPSKQGAAAGHCTTPPFSPSLPGLGHQPYCDDPEQVPCFSIFSQASPNLSPHLDPSSSSRIIMPSPFPEHAGINCINPMIINSDITSNSLCDNHNCTTLKPSPYLLEMVTGNHEMKGSPISFGSSDSHLSEVGLASFWVNQYQS